MCSLLKKIFEIANMLTNCHQTINIEVMREFYSLFTFFHIDSGEHSSTLAKTLPGKYLNQTFSSLDFLKHQND